MAAIVSMPLATKAASKGAFGGLPVLAMRAELVEKAALVVPELPILINMVSKRVKQLTQGRPALIDKKPGMREADVALQEIIEGKIKVERLEEGLIP
ncbi:MAG TPA: DNA-directed RNA polymerase subunit omega [Candidatus Saccharimonadia bacterium]|nr:DNA-directed RNA polymerase subunit omega [Candidatus Saccharimonadia bacterium]